MMAERPAANVATFCDLVDAACRNANPATTFMIVGGKVLSYGEAIDRMRRLYGVFAAKGLRPGARVGIVTRSASDMAVLLLAGLRAGLTVLNLNPEQAAAERRHAAVSARLGHVFIDRDILDATPLPPGVTVTTIEKAGAGAGMLGRLLGRGDPVRAGLAAEIAGASPVAPPDAFPDDAIGLMLLTSGTTERPKVVQLSHRNLAAQLQTFLALYGYGRGTRILNPLPLHFTDGIFHGPLVTFLSGATLYRPESFQIQEMDDLLHGIYRDRITHFIVVPAILSMIDRLHDAFLDVFRTADFRFIRSSGDRLPEALWRSVSDRFAVRVVNTYGLSETVCEAIYCGPSAETFRIGTIGKPRDCEIRIVGGDDRDVAVGETGELLIRGENIMVGYFEQPELTKESFLGDWFRTGDFATVDAEGFVTIVGRKKALIISGGANIQPQDIVDVLLDHPSVAEAFAFGLPHPVFGETVAAAVVPRNAEGPLAPSEADLVEHCRARLAPNKVPRRIAIVAALPRNAAGKVLVEALRNGTTAAVGTVGWNIADDDLERQVIAVAAQVFGVNPSTLKLSSEARTTLGWDSFAHVNLLLAVENRFGISLSARDVLSVNRLEHLVERVAAARSNRSSR